ncbi:MAG TPA: IclR family transcriptional regulator [Candidatus Egerieenecus merdigallinarum]|nr:IclR family transcriptional regulator [Candidatus Egerieenecus merdigallinarum]
MAEAVNRSLQRGLQLLELLSEHPEGMELHEICKALELPKSSGHNLLQQLVQSRYVWVSSHGKYRLTLKTFEVGASAVHATEISQVLRQYMQEVFAVCNETMHCGVLSGREVLYIDKIESTQSIRMASHVGIRMPLYATAMGKAFLAAMPDEAVRTLFNGVSLAPLTEHTITSLDQLMEQLREIRQTGIAVEDQENAVNVSCIGVAICDREGKPAYALSISAPSFRVNGAEISAWGKLLLRAKDRIERVLKAL